MMCINRTMVEIGRAWHRRDAGAYGARLNRCMMVKRACKARLKNKIPYEPIKGMVCVKSRPPHLM